VVGEQLLQVILHVAVVFDHQHPRLAGVLVLGADSRGFEGCFQRFDFQLQGFGGHLVATMPTPAFTLYAGNRTVTTVPLPGSLSNWTRPPCASVSFFSGKNDAISLLRALHGGMDPAGRVG
jgi:hypothetical protein